MERPSVLQAILQEIGSKKEKQIDTRDELRECLLNLPSLDVMDNPITINQIINHQARDIPLQQAIMRDPDNYQHQGMQGYEVICKVEPALESDQLIWKIVVPERLVGDLLKWYHLVLGHC